MHNDIITMTMVHCTCGEALVMTLQHSFSMICMVLDIH